MRFRLFKRLFNYINIGGQSSARDKWQTWENTRYFSEMERRGVYYEGRQFEFDAREGGLWNARWWGPGWDDICNMLPEETSAIDVRPDSTNIVRPLVDSVSVVYSTPPQDRGIYSVDLTKVEEEVVDSSQPQLSLFNGNLAHSGHRERLNKASALYQTILDSTNFNALLGDFNKQVTLYNTAFQFYGWDESYNRLKVRNIPPHQLLVEQEGPVADPGNIQDPNYKLIYLVAEHEDYEKCIWSVWYQDRYWYEDSKGERYQDPSLTRKGTNQNPYLDERGETVKPFIVVHSVTNPTNIYYPGSDLLVLNSQTLDRQLTGLDRAVTNQSFALAVIRGADQDTLNSLVLSPSAIVSLPDPDADMKYLQPLAPIAETFNTIIKKLRTIGKSFARDPDILDPEQKVVSGVASAQRKQNQAELREDQFKIWQVFEREAYWLTSIVWNTHTRNSELPIIRRYQSPIDMEYIDIQVVFGDFEISSDPLAKALEQEKLISLNVLTAVDIIMKRDRVNKETALARYLSNMRFNFENPTTPRNFTAYMAALNSNEGQESSMFEEEEDSQRLGQPGNRPEVEDKEPNRTGESTTASSGNKTIDLE